MSNADPKRSWSPFDSPVGGYSAATAFYTNDHTFAQDPFPQATPYAFGCPFDGAFAATQCSFPHPDTLGSAMDASFLANDAAPGIQLPCDHFADAAPQFACNNTPSFPPGFGKDTLGSSVPASEAHAGFSADRFEADKVFGDASAQSGRNTNGFLYMVNNFILFVQPMWEGWDFNNQPPLQNILADLILNLCQDYAANYGAYATPMQQPDCTPPQEPPPQIVEIFEPESEPGDPMCDLIEV